MLRLKSLFSGFPVRRKHLVVSLMLMSAIAFLLVVIVNSQNLVLGTIHNLLGSPQIAKKPALASSAVKPRVVVMTDIGDDPDDQQSMVRFLSYANDFDIEGITVTPLYRPGRPNSVAASMAKMNALLNAYGKVYNNLILHDSTFPTQAYLESVTKTGNHGLKFYSYGYESNIWDWIGEGNTPAGPEWPAQPKDSEASKLIVSILQKDDPRPIWFFAWGGTYPLAQALYRIEKSGGNSAEIAKIKSKIRLYDIDKQDTTFPNYIQAYHKDIKIIASGITFNQIHTPKEPEHNYKDDKWVETNIRNNHGELGAEYPNYSGDVVGIKEGDSPTFIYLIPNGLSDPEHPDWGNWGGRYQLNTANGSQWYEDITDQSGINMWGRWVESSIPQWRKDFQNDFEARMDWHTQSYASANHNPIAAFDGNASKQPIFLKISPGQTVTLSAAGSSDPDRNSLSYRWFQYEKPGTYNDRVAIRDATSMKASFVAPDAVGKTIHIILEVKDNGKPSLVSYRRIVCTIS